MKSPFTSLCSTWLFCQLSWMVIQQQTNVEAFSSITPPNSPFGGVPAISDLLKDVPKAPSRSVFGLTKKMNGYIKRFFIQRGIDAGVPYTECVGFLKENEQQTMRNFKNLLNHDIHGKYQDYYTRAFHGYEEGNLSWEAATECLPASYVMASGRIPEVSPILANEWLRGNQTVSLKEYFREQKVSAPQNILDLAGGIGLSTRALMDCFPDSTNVVNLDLSPYFLATSKTLLETPGSIIYDKTASKLVSYHHGYAEKAPFPSNSFDLVSISYLVHELPASVTKNVVREAMRVLKPGGVLNIVDVCSDDYYKMLPPLRMGFRATEPHLEEFVGGDLEEVMSAVGFEGYSTNCKHHRQQWLGKKPNA